MRLDAAMEIEAAEQQGCITVSRVRAMGATQTEINRLRESKLWRPVGLHVLGLRGWPDDDLHKASAAVLSAGPTGALGFGSVASMWDLGDYYQLIPAQVGCVAGTVGALAAGRIRPIVGLPDTWVTQLRGIRVVRPELCIYELCG